MKIPTFTSTEKSLTFGRTATPRQRDGLLKLHRHYLKESSAAMDKGDMQEALDLAVKAQFLREAWEVEEKEKKTYGTV